MTEKEMQDLVDGAKKSGVPDSSIRARYGGLFPRKPNPEKRPPVPEGGVITPADPKELAKILKNKKR